MSSESKEVRDLLVVLRDQVVRCTEPLRGPTCRECIVWTAEYE